MPPPRPLTPTEKTDWLRLCRTENVGPITFRQLMRHYGSTRAALDALPQLAQRGGKKNFKIPTQADIESEITRAQKIGAKIIAWNEPDYPEALSAIEDAPPLITVRGHASILHKCSMVSSARATPRSMGAKWRKFWRANWGNKALS